MHYKVLIHYWKDYEVTLFDPITQQKTNIALDMSINENAESISAGYRIFIIGGGWPVSGQMYVVDFNNHKLVQKESMLFPKCRLALCNAGDCIYSIGG